MRDRRVDDRHETAGLSGNGEEARDRGRAALDRAAAASDRKSASQDREEARRERERASLDGLTGALQRDHGLTDVRREIDRARRTDDQLVLAFVDVDGLKRVNDTYGHAAGDQLLRDVVAALRARLRSYDLIVRYGGDEFVCALPGADIATAQNRFDEVEETLKETNGQTSITVGLDRLRDPDSLDDLIARADAALYAAPRRATRTAGSRAAL
jgi:diguanylate cyclase (GGDEF)-like protein